MNSVHVSLKIGMLAVIIGAVILGIWYMPDLYKILRKPFSMKHTIYTSQQVRDLFPTTPGELTYLVDATIDQIKKDRETLLAIPADKRTFKNTIEFLDQNSVCFAEIGNILSAIQNLSPDEKMRTRAEELLLRMQSIVVDFIFHDPLVYKAVTDYASGNRGKEDLTLEEDKYLTELIRDFEKNGLNLPSEQQEKVKKLEKKIAELDIAFQRNINNDVRKISVNREELAGLDDQFIAKLTVNDQGQYELGTDYPTYHAVMHNCSVAKTRKALWMLFNNRAYPINEDVLKRLIQARDELAQLLGFKSFAQMQLDTEMAKTPETVYEFLQTIITRSDDKLATEIGNLKRNLPEGVVLDPKGRFNPEDMTYVVNNYEKSLKLDNEKLKEYFPAEHAIKKVFDIYSTFLGITFKQEPLEGLWHPDVQYCAVYDKNTDVFLGHLLLDLHPRPFKYGHACMMDIIRAARLEDGSLRPSVIVVVANFPQSTPERPGLLSYNDVKTFFHEFGHAMHGLFGATRMFGFSGVNVKMDFVEMPSQMLEEWFYDPTILKTVSRHYRTGEPLDDETIATIIAVKQSTMGYWVQRQVWLALASLDCFGPGSEKNPHEILQQISRRLFSQYVVEAPEGHFESSFGHLTGYGARYYSYLWSKVFALDMFGWIKKQGLLNPVAGKHYIDTVISKGGSVDPEQLLVNFLGRKPNSDAFWKDCGL